MDTQVTLAEMYAHMGYFAKGIVITLLLMSVYVATITVRKLIQLSRARKATLKFSKPFSDALQSEDFSKAEQLVNQHPNSHLASAFRRVFPSLTFHSADQALSAVEVASVQRVIDLNTLEQLAKFRRGLGVLATVGATAPFVGLLGTTMGVVKAFQGMGAAGSSGFGAIAAGIAEALITTAFGLLVAIPAVWLYNYFINRIDYVSMEITYATKEFMDFLLKYEARLMQGKGGESNVGEMERLSHGSSAATARART
jgi:biopolymer transport protein ExbB/biopolymer transport protein TolQ